MDMITLAFYAVICGALGYAAPHLGRASLRFGVGVCVGLAAATILPLLKNIIGGY